jgi:nitrate reductase NapE component
MSKKTQARCTQSMLTVGFHAATPPLVWRFDLERNHSFTLSLQGEEGDWELGITSPKGDFYPVVHFAAREDAEEALATVEKTLSRKKGSLLGKAFMIVGLLALVIVVVVVGYGFYAQHQMMNAAMTSTSTPFAASAAPPSAAPPVAAEPAPDGIPLSADDVLKPPR